ARSGRDRCNRAGASRRHRDSGGGRRARPPQGDGRDGACEGDVRDGERRLMRKAAAVVGLALIAALPQLAQAETGAAPRLTIYAAASLTEVFPRIDRRPAYNFAGSNQLALQIRQGAPADIFASAAPNFTQDLYRERRVEKPRTFASNRLVLAIPRSNPAPLTRGFDLRGKRPTRR